MSPSRRPPPRRPPEVERKIHFFRAHVGTGSDGAPKPVKITPTLTALGKLPFTNTGRYWLQADGNSLCSWPDGGSPYPRLRVGTSRRAALPSVEQGGQLSGLSIPGAAGLCESIHLVFFPNDVVGADFNFYGPRPSRAAAYLAQKVPAHCRHLQFEPLLRRDVAEALDRMRAIKLLDLRIRSSYSAIISELDESLGSAFDAAISAAQSETAEIVLQPAPYQRRPINERILNFARRLARRDDMRGSTLTFEVKGWDEDGRPETLNVLNDLLIAEKRIVRVNPRERRLDTDAAYAAIEEAWQERRTELEAAVAVVTT